jgi:hypothetical protein
MPMELKQEEAAGARCDVETVQQVIALAARLLGSQQGTFSLAEMEKIAAEIGVQPEFVRQAYGHFREKKQPTGFLRRLWERRKGQLVACWWAGGWAIPVSLAELCEALHMHPLAGVAVLLGLGGYIVTGILLSAELSESQKREQAALRVETDTGVRTAAVEQSGVPTSTVPAAPTVAVNIMVGGIVGSGAHASRGGEERR